MSECLGQRLHDFPFGDMVLAPYFPAPQVASSLMGSWVRDNLKLGGDSFHVPDTERKAEYGTAFGIALDP
jgi:hypothetical protein